MDSAENLMKLRNNKRNIISAICSLWSKSGMAKCITSRPTFKSGTARAVPLTYVSTPLALCHGKRKKLFDNPHELTRSQPQILHPEKYPDCFISENPPSQKFHEHSSTSFWIIFFNVKNCQIVPCWKSGNIHPESRSRSGSIIPHNLVDILQ